MNQAILDVAGDSGRKTLYRLCHEFKKTIADYSISGLSDAMYDTVSAVYAFPGVRELIMELESITNKAHNTIYRVVSYENGTETELLKTSRYSDGIDMMRRLEDALPDYPMAFRGYSGSHIIPIAGYDKETKVKELFMKRDFSISSCKCGNDEPIAAFVGNNFRCVKCSRHDVTRVKSFDHTASLLGTIKRLIEEMVDSKIITKWNSRCDIRFDRRDGRHAYVGIRVRRMLFRSIFRTDGSEIVMRIDSVNGWSSTERFKTARDFVLGLQKRISEECAHNDSNTEVPDTSSMSAASLEQFLRIELWTAGIEPAGIDVGKIDKGLIDVSIHNERGNSVDTVEFKIPF